MVVFDYIYLGTFNALIKLFNINTQIMSSSDTDAFEFTPIFITDLLPSFDINFGFILNYVFLLFFVFLFLNFFFANVLNSVYVNVSEKKLNSFDDLVIIILLLLSFYFVYIFYLLGLVFLIDYENLFVFFFVLLLGIIVHILLNLVFNMGYYLSSFIKGAGDNKSIIYNLLFDYVNILSFHLRVLVQLVRIIVIYGTYYQLVLLYNEFSYSYSYINNLSYSYESYSTMSYILIYIRVVFEIGHTLIIFFMQAVVFSFMVFWLFQFLFTLVFDVDLEVTKK